MVHQSTRCKKLQRVFYCNLSKKVQSGAASGDENSSGPPPVRRAKTPQWGVFRARESPRWCTKKSRNECCGFFVAPFPLGRTRTSRKRSCSSRGDWSLNSVRRTEFLTRPLMVHQSTRCKKLQRVFYCNLSKKVQSGAPSGDENSSGPPLVRRAKTSQWGVFRARESPRWCTRKSRNAQRMLRLFCRTIPFGTDSHFAQALVFSSRGLVAKNGCGFVSRGHD